jgi:hypothetical protein
MGDADDLLMCGDVRMAAPPIRQTACIASRSWQGAYLHQEARRRLAAGSTDKELARAEELYVHLVARPHHPSASRPSSRQGLGHNKSLMATTTDWDKFNEGVVEQFRANQGQMLTGRFAGRRLL